MQVVVPNEQKCVRKYVHLPRLMNCRYTFQSSSSSSFFFFFFWNFSVCPHTHSVMAPSGESEGERNTAEYIWSRFWCVVVKSTAWCVVWCCSLSYHHDARFRVCTRDSGAHSGTRRWNIKHNYVSWCLNIVPARAGLRSRCCLVQLFVFPL